MNCDYVLTAKKIYTLDEALPTADWVAVKGKKIMKVGNGPLPDGCPVKDLGESVVLPGLMDSHAHGGAAAIMLSGVNLMDATSIDDVLQLIEERCRTTDEDLVFAPFFIPPLIREGRYPTRQELDRVSHGKKVMVVSVTLHSSSINTKAYESIEFPVGLPGRVFENGEFTGELATDEVHFLALGTLVADMPEGRYEKYIDLFGDMCREVGLTTVHCLEGFTMKGDKDIDMWLKKIEDGSLPFHCVLYPQVWDYEKCVPYGLPRHGGCLTLDGADMDYTMALDEPYTNRPEVRGDLYHKDSEVYQLVAKAHRDNKQCAFHAMGERAIDQALDAYRRVIAEQGQKDLRHRIEHFTLPRSEHARMAAELGIVVTHQPEFAYLYDAPDGQDEYFGPVRAWRMEQTRCLNDMGVIVGGGSDAPVNSLNPLTGIHALVHARRSERRFDITGALKVYTYNVAYAAHEEHERGAIKEGFYADFTALEEDPYAVPGKINEILVTHTISEGRFVFVR